MKVEDYKIEEFCKAFKNILNDTLSNKILNEQNPKAYLLGGQPGAGKSILNNYTKKINNDNIIIINADEYRKYHPNFKEIEREYGIDYPKYTSKFSSQITEKLIDELSNKKYNLCIEGTLRTINVPINTCNLLKSKGYKVELYIMATKENISYLSTKLRYYKFLSKGMVARDTPKEHHDLVFNLICDNLNEIYKKNVFDSIKIFDRQLNLLYDKEDEKIPGNLLYEFYKKPYSKYEVDSLKDIITQLKEVYNTDYAKYLENGV